MSVINATPLLAAAGGDYQISRSVRLRSSASAYFNRTPASTTNTTTWTWSAWIKRGQSAQGKLFGAATGTSNTWYFQFSDNVTDALTFGYFNGTNAVQVTTTPVYRDYSAWYHVVLAVDTTQATASNRVKIYVNGVQVTSFATATYPTLNQTTWINNNTAPQYIGATSTNTSSLWDGYLTEVNFIDGQALTPSSFGETDSITGVWKPKKYAGTYGTNGFFLNFSDNSSNTATTIGKDYSGNGNNWTPNNISVTSGVTYDSMLDVPTMYADGGNGRGNYCTLNPLMQRWAVASASFSNANLQITTTGASTSFGFGTQEVSSGKWYWETLVSAIGTSTPAIGVTTSRAQATVQTDSVVYLSNGQKEVGGTASSYGATYTTNDVIGVALDCDAGTVTFYKNNTSQGSISLVTSAGMLPHFQVILNSVLAANFGQRPFSYTPPTGFKALNTQNLPEPTIKKGNQYFDATTYTGTGSALTVTNSGSMQPDLVWIKSRSNVTNHNLTDAVRGVDKLLFSNSTAAEATFSGGLSSFNSGGFSLASGGDVGFSASGYTYVGWQWKESPSAGFDIVTYSGTGAAQTVAHNLGVAPRFIIAKRRNAAVNWFVGSGALPSWSYALEGLNTTAAANSGATAVWNATAPTSSVFSVGTDLSASGGTYVAYLFAEVAGFSKFGSYTGNGSADGPFVFCGFRPKFILIKDSANATDWKIHDTSRDPYNQLVNSVAANSSAAEGVYGGAQGIDILSNGFKIRQSGAPLNTSGATTIFAAFAENPFKNSLAR